MCMEIQHKGVCQEIHIAQGISQVLYAVWFSRHTLSVVHTRIGGALSDVLYYLVVWLREIL